MNDLERLFQQIVLNLAARDPALLRQPIPLAKLRDSIVPYRANRRALLLESSEDYELALMRLCSGEGGFARTEPGETQEEFASELRSPNPDLTVVYRHEKAVVSLDPGALAKATDPQPDRSFAPREQVSTATGEPREPQKVASDPIQTAGKRLSHCTRCRAALPVGRAVNFCPECGYNLALRRCPQCNVELEAEWRHCISCGTPLRSGR